MDKRRKWFAILLEEGLRMGVLSPADVLRHATPAVLAVDLPPSLIAQVLQAGITSGAFNSDLVVGTLGPEQLAEHVPLSVLWACLDEAANLIIEEHPLTRWTQESVHLMVDPGAVQNDDVADIEIIEG